MAINTVYFSPEKRQALQPFLRLLSVAEAIRRIYLGISVGEMFNE